MFNRVAGLVHKDFARNFGGFTIVEVLTVLAVTGVMFIGAVTLLQTQNGRSQFSQSINDLDGKINKYITDLHSGVDPTAEKYTCAGYSSGTWSASTKPTLSGPVSGNIGSSDTCLFLGKALQVNPGTANDNKLYVYLVVGNRLWGGADGVTPTPIDTFAHANPETGFASQSSTTETYQLLYGLKVKSSTYVLAGGSTISNSFSTLVGFYNGLSTAGSGSQVTKAFVPVSVGTAGNLNSGVAQTCIEESNNANCPNSGIYTFPQSGSTLGLSGWDLCLTDGSINAILSVIPTSAGIRTEIKYVGICP